MSINPASTGNNPPPAPPSSPAIVLVLAVACGGVTGYFTDWETGAAVFLAVVSLFTSERHQT